MADDNVPITRLSTVQQQHMLFLFFPLRSDTQQQAAKAMHAVLTPHSAPHASAHGDAGSADPRVLPGVHYFMFYHLAAGQTPTPKLPVPSFQTAPGKDLLVVMSIYDRDFAPYISAFTSQKEIAAGLNGILSLMDESGLNPPKESSAATILANGGVARNTTAFFELLMRYNFADPTIPAAAHFPVNTPAHPKYTLGATFPGLTVGSILENYHQKPGQNASALWPPQAVPIKFEPSIPPPSPK